MSADQSRPTRDAGFTLVEILIALVLSSIIAGVTVSAMLTSMNVIDVTTEQISGSTDTGLIAAWFYRDAQAAGGTLPSTGQPDPDTGVSITNAVSGWQGCGQPGALVVRFSWSEHLEAGAQRDVVVTYAIDGPRLTRRLCAGTDNSLVVLGERVSTAVATCDPDPSCAAAPDRVNLRVTGLAERVEVDHTFSASLRDLTAPLLDASTTVSAPLVVLGGGAACPALDLAGARAITVLGDAVLAGDCGPSALSGNASLLQPTAATSVIASGVADPLTTLVPPPGSCAGASNPAPLGAATGPTDVVVHPLPVVIAGIVHFQPGRYVFCAGLTVAPGAVVDGSGVTLIVAGGHTQVASGARVDLTAPASGDLANVLLWVRSTQAVTLDLGPAAVILRGLVYVPDADVTITTDVVAALGGLVAQSVTFAGPGSVRLGLPITTIAIDPVTLAAGQTGASYTPVTFTATGGDAPYSFVATGLPVGFSLATGGLLSGTPTTAGTTDALITVIDDSGNAASIVVPMTITAPPAVAGPASLPAGQVGVLYTATTMAATGGTGPMSWAADGLPSGLALSAGGVLNGVPNVGGSYAVTVTVTDGLGAIADRLYTLDVDTPAYAVTGPAQLPGGQVGTAYSPTTMIAAGGTPAYVWSATGLPDGVTMSMSGQVTGTPTTAGTYSVVVYTSDATSTFATRSYTVVVVPAAPPAPPGCPTSTTGWRGEYYANTSLTAPLVLCRDDADVDFAWNGASPGAGVPGTDFSARWTRTVEFTQANYQFVMGSDDGARLYIDGALVMDDWVLRSHTTKAVTLPMTLGPHVIVMEFFQSPGQSSATLDWLPIVPAVCPTTVTGWLGEYFHNRTLTGPSLLCRDDATIDFDWSQGTPGAPIPSDDFSVRWTRTMAFTAGSYTFTVGADDGTRLYIDGTLVGDWWYDTSYATRTVTRTLSAGNHTIVMEFYERGGHARATLHW